MHDVFADESLMRQVQQGALAQMGLLFERYHGPLYSFFVHTTRDRVASQDLVQEVFLRLIRYRQSYQPERPFKPWLYQMARNVLYDHHKRKPPPVEKRFQPTGIPRTLSKDNRYPTAMVQDMMSGSHVLHPGRRLAFWLLLPFVTLQGLRLRRRAPRFSAAEGSPHGRTGQGTLLRLLAIGDSVIAGVGAPTVGAALPSQVSQALARRLGREVRWSAFGCIGATAAKVHARLLPKLPAQSFDVVVVSVGVNDVTGLRRTHRWRSDLGTLLNALRTHSPKALMVVVGLPPLHGFPLLPQPLRFLFGMRARTFDVVAEQEVSRRQGFLYIPTQFEPRPERFAADGYHPSPASYQEWGETLADLMEQPLQHDALHDDIAG